MPTILFFDLKSHVSSYPLKKILIVEDDPDTLELIELILRQEGYAVIKINRPVPIKEVSGIRPDLVILDYLLPFGLGSDLCLEIKRNPVTRTILETGAKYRAADLFRGLARLDELRRECSALLKKAPLLVVPTMPTIPAGLVPSGRAEISTAITMSAPSSSATRAA